jgi:formate/nitrite transporter FocA (FNT family)
MARYHERNALTVLRRGIFAVWFLGVDLTCLYVYAIKRKHMYPTQFFIVEATHCCFAAAVVAVIIRGAY